MATNIDGGTGIDKVQESAAYQKSNILGTVSATGTYPNLVPTGAIMESGSNSNGDYVKYADGTMICRHSINLGDITLFGNGTFESPYNGGGVNWQFPINFSTAPTLSYSANTTPGSFTSSRCLSINYDTITSTAVNVIRANRTSSSSSTNDVFAHLTAIGRWK